MLAGVWCEWSLSTGVKRPLCDGDHSPQYPAESKKWWSYVSNPQHTLLACTTTASPLNGFKYSYFTDLLFGRAECFVFQFAIQKYRD
jgi:hypothetical protein